MTDNAVAARANAPQAGETACSRRLWSKSSKRWSICTISPALQQHPLARYYDHDSDLSAKTAGHKLRYELIKAIEALKPQPEIHFRVRSRGCTTSCTCTTSKD